MRAVLLSSLGEMETWGKRQSDLYRTSHLAEGQASRIIHPCESQPGALCVWPRCSGDVTNETWISAHFSPVSPSIQTCFKLNQDGVRSIPSIMKGMAQSLHHFLLNIHAFSQMQISLIGCQRAQMSLCKSAQVLWELIVNMKWNLIKIWPTVINC